MSGRLPILLLAGAATAGLFFASFSTFDFVQHLDRQMHDIHCSFAPGLVEETEKSEGCQVTMMSPWSSVLRKSVWGGIPISLGAMSVFAFLMFRAVDLLGRPSRERPPAVDFLAAGTLIPVLASGVMGYIAYTQLGAACKLCIGIYASSGVAFLAALLARRGVLKAFVATGEPRVSASSVWLPAVGQLGMFVALPTLAYAILAPDYQRFVGGCGGLRAPDDPYDVMVALDDHGTGAVAIEVFDPLCPACKAFEERLTASGLGPRLRRQAVLFPLDAECNWMVSDSLHPGACAISEAVLCAEQQPSIGVRAVVDWAFAHQPTILDATKRDPNAAREMVTREFGALADCIGSAEVQQRLNKSLRWTVANELPVLTPQLYVSGVKLCDEDTDLGLDWALARILQAHERGELAQFAPPPTQPPPPAPAPKRKPSAGPDGRRPAPTPATAPTPAPAPTPTPAPEPAPAPAPIEEKALPPPPPEPLPEPAPAPVPVPGGTP
jgi:uncharacterized membrane protein